MRGRCGRGKANQNLKLYEIVLVLKSTVHRSTCHDMLTSILDTDLLPVLSKALRG